MRADSVTLAVVLLGTTLAFASDAEARGRRGSRAAFVPAATGSIDAASAGRVRREEPAASVAPAAPRPVPPVAAPVAAAPVKNVRTAQAWCDRGRIVGSGSGFCEVN